MQGKLTKNDMYVKMYIDAFGAYNKKRDTFDIPVLDVSSIKCLILKTPFQRRFGVLVLCQVVLVTSYTNDK